MQHKLLLCLFILLNLQAFSQDAYHQTLQNQLQTEYALNGGIFVLSSNETTNANAFGVYGNQTNSIISVSGQDFTVANSVTINATGANPWDAGMNQRNNTTVSQNDKVLLVCWLRIASTATANSSVGLFAEDSADFSKEAFAKIDLSNNWLQYFIPFEATQTYAPNTLSFGFHLAYDAQEVEVGGFTVINYENNYPLNQLPLKLNNDLYGGHEANAPWRAAAASRIAQYRKADLMVRVVDANNNPIPNAQVSVNMQQHEYGFGSAVKTERVAGNSQQNNTYESKILDLDGNGHGFNIVVNENSLKWRGWQYEWSGTHEESVNAIAWALANDMEYRGHNVVWPGVSYLPDDIVNAINSNNTTYIKNRIMGHIDEMLNYPGIQGSILEWDVINEFTTNDDIANVFQGEPGYPTGREIYTDIINKIRTDHPNVKQYINDYVTIGSGTMNSTNYTTYKSYIQEQVDAGTPFDGVGFQAHIGASPTSMYVVYDILEDFHQTFGMEAKITEYDINDLVSETTAANYMRDFLTMVFSHPSTNAFLMWGFWDGAHWMDNAPIFNLDWSLKPSGQQFIDLVFNEWWTDEMTITDGLGETTVNGFKGDYIITVTHNGETQQVPFTLSESGTIEVQLGSTGPPCSQILNDDFEGGFGNWNDGGNDCAVISSSTYANSGTTSIRIRDNSGSSSSMFTNNLDLSSAESVEFSFSYYPVSMENGEDFFLEISTNGGTNFSIYQEWNRGVEFQNNTRYNETVLIDDVNFTSNTVFRLRCDASGNNDQIYIDDVNIQACSGDPNCTPGTACDDGDPCTSGETYDANCNCNGGTFNDADNDGVCDADDQCPGQNDNLIGTSCDDLDNCTTGDVYDNNCQCAGSYTDQDGDGFCIGDDPDDNDGCNPDPNSGACSTCNTVNSESFESGFGTWNDGGNDCARVTTNANTGSYSVRLRDNSGAASSVFSDILNLNGVTALQVSFSFLASGMENGKDFFLEVSTNGGSSYANAQTWVSGTDFQNNVRYNETISLTGFGFNNSTVIRFRCDAANNGDHVYIDDIVLEDCSAGNLVGNDGQLSIKNESLNSDESQWGALQADKSTLNEQNNLFDFDLFPNPTRGLLQLNLEKALNKEVEINFYNALGMKVMSLFLDDVDKKTYQINLTNLETGYYLVQVKTADGKVAIKPLIVN